MPVVRLSFQVPVKYMEALHSEMDFHFALAHLVLRDSSYAAYFRSHVKFVLLDNGVHELGEPLSMRELLDAAELCNADAIIPPDWHGDGHKTRWHFRRTVAIFRPGFLWPVVQAATQEEVHECAQEYDLYGVPFICFPYRLLRKGLRPCPTTKAKWHLLSYDRVEQLPSLAEVATSMDTGKPIRLAQHGLPFGDVPEGLPKLDMYGELDVELARANIRELRKRLAAPRTV